MAQTSSIFDTLEFTGKTSDGQGFFPPLIRTINHIVAYIKTGVKEELEQAANHANNIVLPYSTEKTSNYLRQLVLVAPNISNQEQAVEFLHRLSQLGSYMDRELLGIKVTDPGIRL